MHRDWTDEHGTIKLCFFLFLWRIFGKFFDEFFEEFFFDDFFDDFLDDFFQKIFFTNNLLTIASFRIGVPWILFFPYCQLSPNGPNRRIHVPKCGL